jgi:hypothetical protein
MTRGKITLFSRVSIAAAGLTLILLIMRAAKFIHIQWIVAFFPILIIPLVFIMVFAFWVFYKN